MKTSKESEEISTLSLEEIQNLSDNEKIELLSSLFFSPNEIAKFLKVDDEKDFVRQIVYNKQSKASKSYYYGQMASKIKFRINEYNFAIQGSSQALDNMSNYYNKQKESENG